MKWRKLVVVWLLAGLVLGGKTWAGQAWVEGFHIQVTGAGALVPQEANRKGRLEVSYNHILFGLDMVQPFDREIVLPHVGLSYGIFGPYGYMSGSVRYQWDIQTVELALTLGLNLRTFIFQVNGKDTNTGGTVYLCAQMSSAFGPNDYSEEAVSFGFGYAFGNSL